MSAISGYGGSARTEEHDNGLLAMMEFEMYLNTEKKIIINRLYLEQTNLTADSSESGANSLPSEYLTSYITQAKSLAN